MESGPRAHAVMHALTHAVIQSCRPQWRLVTMQSCMHSCSHRTHAVIHSCRPQWRLVTMQSCMHSCSHRTHAAALPEIVPNPDVSLSAIHSPFIDLPFTHHSLCHGFMKTFEKLILIANPGLVYLVLVPCPGLCHRT